MVIVIQGLRSRLMLTEGYGIVSSTIIIKEQLLGNYTIENILSGVFDTDDILLGELALHLPLLGNVITDHIFSGDTAIQITLQGSRVIGSLLCGFSVIEVALQGDVTYINLEGKTCTTVLQGAFVLTDRANGTVSGVTLQGDV